MAKNKKRVCVPGTITLHHKTDRVEYIGEAEWDHEKKRYIGKVVNITPYTGEDSLTFCADVFVCLPKALKEVADRHEAFCDRMKT
jgi:hypothetical protein